MNTNDVSSLSLEESTDELVRLLDGTEENQDPPMDDATILQQIQDQRSQILKLKETLPLRSQEATETRNLLCTQPESSSYEQLGKEEKSKYFFPASPSDSTDGVIQMTQPSDISLRERVDQYVRSQKRDTLARGLESLGMDIFSWKREWNSRWKELLSVC